LCKLEICVGFLDWVELLALYVLYERKLKESVIGDVADDRRQSVEACELRRSKASLASDELVTAVRGPTDQNRLYEAV
jgi:hypothetical protein